MYVLAIDLLLRVLHVFGGVRCSCFMCFVVLVCCGLLLLSIVILLVVLDVGFVVASRPVGTVTAPVAYCYCWHYQHDCN